MWKRDCTPGGGGNLWPMFPFSKHIPYNYFPEHMPNVPATSMLVMDEIGIPLGKHIPYFPERIGSL